MMWMRSDSILGRGETFVFAIRLSVGTTQPPVQRLPEVVYRVECQSELEGDHSPPYTNVVKKTRSLTFLYEFIVVLRLRKKSVCSFIYRKRGQSGRGVKLTTHIHLVPKSEKEWSYTSISRICLHGVVIS
jgi:hypothetical protein